MKLHPNITQYLAAAGNDGAVTGTGTTGYSKAELADLSPEELAALEADDGGADETVNRLAAEADGTEAGKEKTGEGGEAAAGTEGGDKTVKAAEGEGATGETAATADIDPAAGPIYTAADAGDVAKETTAIKDAIKTARAEEKAALKQLNDGEIEFEAYSAIKDKSDVAVDEANEKLRALDKQVAKAEVAEEMTQQQIGREWNAECAKMLKQGKADGLDYGADEKLRTEFNTLIKVFGNEAAEKGMVDTKGLEASKWALGQAHNVMKVRHGKAAAAPAAAAAATGAGAAATPAAPGAQRHDLKSLTGLPAADRADVEGDQFSKLAGLEGEDLEMAMANMSPKDVEKYLATHD